MSRDAHQLEGRAIIATVLARRFWRALSVRVDLAAVTLFADDLAPEARRVVDVAFDAAEVVWTRHRVLVEPCRRIVGTDFAGVDQPRGWSMCGSDQAERYTAHYPSGETRVIDRAQLLMMAGFDAEDAAQA